MNKVNRILVFVATALLGLSFFFPLWQISLWAPQYPEGLSMQIWSSKLTGDIQTINILNHYIGMSHIEEAAFAELKYFPILFGILIALGLLAGALNTRPLVYIWTSALIAFSVVALYDFWAWEFRFGHQLNPDAAIKMEDMVYQPPLFGEKVFLNIMATAYPGIAGWGMMASVIAACAISALSFVGVKKKESSKL